MGVSSLRIRYSRSLWSLISLLGFISLMTGCLNFAVREPGGGGAGGGGTNFGNTGVEVNRARVTASRRALSEPAWKGNSCEELENQLANNAVDVYREWLLRMKESSAQSQSSAGGSSNEVISAPVFAPSESSFVAPNTRVENVQEGDLIQWDDRYQYRVTRKALHRVKIPGSGSGGGCGQSGVALCTEGVGLDASLQADGHVLSGQPGLPQPGQSSLESFALPYGRHQFVLDRGAAKLAILSSLWAVESDSDAGAQAKAFVPSQEQTPGPRRGPNYGNDTPSPGQRVVSTGVIELRILDISGNRMWQVGEVWRNKKAASYSEQYGTQSDLELRAFVDAGGVWRVLVKHTVASPLTFDHPPVPTGERLRDAAAWDEVFSVGSARIRASIKGTAKRLQWKSLGDSSFAALGEIGGGQASSGAVAITSQRPCNIQSVDTGSLGRTLTFLGLWNGQTGQISDEFLVSSSEPIILIKGQQMALAETRGDPYFSTASVSHLGVHQFEFSSNGKIIYTAGGVLDGEIGRRSFAQHADAPRWLDFSADGDLRVVLTSKRSHRLVVLGNRDGRLYPIGQSDSFGAGEAVKAVHFAGDLAFAVTFRERDPLHIIDLKEKCRPRLRGELQIPGYSTSLLPIGEGFYLGYGNSGAEGPQAQRNRIKISLFDLRDLDAPSEVRSIILSDSNWGSYAERTLDLSYSEAESMLVFPYLKASCSDSERCPATGPSWDLIKHRESDAIGRVHVIRDPSGCFDLRELSSIMPRTSGFDLRPNWVNGKLAYSNHAVIGWVPNPSNPSLSSELSLPSDGLPYYLTQQYGMCGGGL